jgi:phosphoribosyl 1,2-cyclic phosphate phosphodiesterase
MIMQVTFLGTGAAEGIPAINCDCRHCRRARTEGGKLQRERSAILLQLPDYNVLVEVPPNTRGLINKYQVNDLQGILATHAAYNHIGGLKEFEYWPTPLDFLAETNLFKVIHKEHWTERLDEIMFHIPYYPGATLDFGHFSLTPFAARRHQPPPADLRSVHQSWGKADCLCLQYSWPPDQLYTLSDGRRRRADRQHSFLRTQEEESHLSVEEAIILNEVVGAKKVILTHANHSNLPHDELEAYVAQFEGISVAYDGLTVEV